MHWKIWFKQNRIVLVFLTVLVFIAYANALANGFVADDRGIIIHAQSWNLQAVFSQAYFFFVRQLVEFISYKIGGLNPFIFRLPNIFFHVASVWLVYTILHLLTRQRVALLAASLFAVHPILIESVTWISGGVYSQYSFFFLLSFLFYLLSRQSIKFYILSLLAFTASLFSSEKAIVLAMVYPVFAFSYGNLRKEWKKTLPYFIISVLLFFLHSERAGTRTEFAIEAAQASDSLANNLFARIPISVTSYLDLLFWPNDLTIYHTELTFTPVEFVIREIIFVIFIGIILFTLLKKRKIFFWLAFFFIALSATLTPIGSPWIIAERYAYLATLGIFVPVAWVIARIMESTKLRVAATVGFVTIILVLTIRTIVRNIDWYNEDNLWLAAARTSPSSAQNHNNLGDYYGRHGDLKNSIKEFTLAIELRPNYADAYHNLGNAYRDSGNLDEAIKNWEKALSFNPDIWQSYQNIAAIYYQQGEFEKAKEYIEKGITIDPQNANLHLILGLILVKTGEKEKAREILRQILTIDPTNQLAKQGLQELEQGEGVKEVR